MTRHQLPVLLAVLLAACGESSTSTAAPDAQQVKEALSGGAASANPICALFTADDLSSYAGEALGEGQPAGPSGGCQWLAKDDSGDVLIEIVPAQYHEAPTLAEGYKELPGVGTRGYVAPYMDGWSAAAIVGEESVNVSVAGEKASPATAEALLQETITRRGK